VFFWQDDLAIGVDNHPSTFFRPKGSSASIFLMKYGFKKEAADLTCKTIMLFGNDLKKKGALHEYYDPDSGAPIMNKGFKTVIIWCLI